MRTATRAQETPDPEDSQGPPGSVLTPSEREAVRQAGQLYTLIEKHVVAGGPTRDEDLAEVRAAVHVIQRAVLAQAAARSYPTEFRLLGEILASHPGHGGGRQQRDEGNR